MRTSNPVALGAIALPAQHTLDEEAPDGGERAWIARQEQAQFERDAEHPLSHGNFGKNSVNQVRSRTAHSSGVAGGASASALARKRDEEFLATELAERAQKPKGVNPALEEGAKLLLDVRERLALVLLGADAGLRQGESIALEWGDVDFTAGVLKVRRSSWKGVVGTTKSGRERKVPLTARLRAALKAHRHAKSELVFSHADTTPFTQSAIEAALRFGCKRAGLRRIGSHVRDARAAPKAIQDLVGHATLTMTLRYMHLAPSAFHEAIGLLEVWATSGQCPEPGGLN